MRTLLLMAAIMAVMAMMAGAASSTPVDNYKELTDGVLVIHVDRFGVQASRVNGLQTDELYHQVLGHFYARGYELVSHVAPTHIHTLVLVKRADPAAVVVKNHQCACADKVV